MAAGAKASEPDRVGDGGSRAGGGSSPASARAAAACTLLGLASWLVAALPWLPLTEDVVGMHFIDDGLPWFLAALLLAASGLAFSLGYRRRHPSQAWLKSNYALSAFAMLASGLEVYATVIYLSR